jgi:hypothetical protein
MIWVFIYIGAIWSSNQEANSSFIRSKPSVCQVYIQWINKGTDVVIEAVLELAFALLNLQMKFLSRLAITV